MKGEDEERQGEERGEMGKEGEGREEEKREEEEEERTKGDKRMVDASGDANDIVMTSRSTDHLSTTTIN